MKIYLFLFFATLIAFLISITTGSVNINIFQMSEIEKTIIFNYRLPLSLEAAFIGSILGLSGAILQIILKNPLADGFTTGAASTAALGGVLVICIGLPYFFVPVFASVFGMLGISFAILLSKDSLKHTTLILAGIVVNIVATAIIGFLKYYYEESVGSIVFWLMGGFFNPNYIKSTILFVALIFSFIFFVKNSIKLDIMGFDFFTTSSMGINVKAFRSINYFISAFLVGIAVSFSGIIPFVGLIVPHISRFIGGFESKELIILSTILGALVMLLSETLARTIIKTEELPVGILTSIVGGLFFFYLMLKRKDNWNESG
ncbi:FecCD family ABC transporter permease [Hippea alviniae]|uniref:FecCD family ABC transporter permease n=1 Tax=Hippea alviniae TaxID=1279027 RepID=UPI0003B58E65|nr:iron ABC transporter permease [Hippea alviniae]